MNGWGWCGVGRYWMGGLVAGGTSGKRWRKLIVAIRLWNLLFKCDTLLFPNQDKHQPPLGYCYGERGQEEHCLRKARGDCSAARQIPPLTSRVLSLVQLSC